MKIKDRIQRRLLNLNTFSGIKEWAYWRKLRNHCVKEQPYCSLCGYGKDLEVHHILPRHEYPELILVYGNTAVMCEDCHFHYVHLNNYQDYNPFILELKERVRNFQREYKTLGRKS